MTDPSQRQVDSDIEKSMDLFERADVGETITIHSRTPKRVLVALDGSTQDHALILLTKQLYDRLNCQIGYQLPPSDEIKLNTSSLELLKEIGAERTEIDATIENNYDQILAAAENFEADMLMVPCPFGRDFQSLGEDSAGTVIDMLTAKSKIPFIAIRRPDATGQDPTTHLRMILTGNNPAADSAAQWAVGLVKPNGRLELLLLVEQSFYENFRNTMSMLKPDMDFNYEDLENALAKKYARLHASLQHSARDIGCTYELLVRHEGDEAPVTPEDPKTHPALMVLALQRNDHDSQGEIQDFLRRSPHPVLVVSVD